MILEKETKELCYDIELPNILVDLMISNGSKLLDYEIKQVAEGVKYDIVRNLDHSEEGIHWLSIVLNNFNERNKNKIEEKNKAKLKIV